MLVADHATSAPPDPTVTLLETYASLNPSTITTLTAHPSPLEFLRFVALNRPFVIRGGAAHWEAAKTWDVATLKEILEGQSVNVAVTPKGNADAPVQTSSGSLLFVQPHEEQQPFSDFLDFIVAQEKHASTPQSAPSSPLGGEVRYAQTQNNNLPSEYALLSSSIPSSVPFARIALDSQPDAVNLWIGNSLSITALHKDNYENIYVQIIGRKHFVLLPPVAWAGVGEKLLSGGRYARHPKPATSCHPQAVDNEMDEEEDKFEIVQDEEEGHKVPFATWDPDSELSVEEGNGTKYSQYVEPMRVTLEEGDMLYLPALWYHKVSQSCSDEGICVAVNYWHDMEFAGSFWAMSGFLRDVGMAGAAGAAGGEEWST